MTVARALISVSDKTGLAEFARGLSALVIEILDIGGPSMVRSAAKNADYVTVVVDPADYGVVLAELQQKREVHESTRRRLQARAYAHTAAYDAAISGWLAEQLARAHPEEGGGFAESPPLPEYRRRQSLRYGDDA